VVELSMETHSIMQ